MAAVIKRRRSPEHLAGQLSLRIVLNVGLISAGRAVAEVAGKDISASALRPYSRANQMSDLVIKFRAHPVNDDAVSFGRLNKPSLRRCSKMFDDARSEGVANAWQSHQFFD
jgi:hypothetical protein